MKLLCDQMLIKLGKWLRTAGYDTWIVEEPVLDSAIFKQAEREGRILISRDKHFLEMKGGDVRVVWLESNGVEECARELASKLPIDWLHDPLSRCILCNTCLVRAENGDLAGVPEDVRVFNTEYTKCPNCGKVFWMGSHTDRMLAKLEEWAE